MTKRRAEDVPQNGDAMNAKSDTRSCQCGTVMSQNGEYRYCSNCDVPHEKPTEADHRYQLAWARKQRDLYPTRRWPDGELFKG